MINQEEIHLMIQSEEKDKCKKAFYLLRKNFKFLHDKNQAWEDIIKVTEGRYQSGWRDAAEALGSVFSLVPDKNKAWNKLHQLTLNEYKTLRRAAAVVLGLTFSHIPDKNQAWDDLHRLTLDKKSFVRRSAADALGSAFFFIPNKIQAWDDLHRFINDLDGEVQWNAIEAIGLAFSNIPDKNQAWDDLHQSTQKKTNKNNNLRRAVAVALGSAFPYIPDKNQAWDDLHRLTQDEDVLLCVSANHSLGRVSIIKATEAKSEDEFREELENALYFFEISSKQSIHFNPARFCLPFYRSFYALIKKEEAETEVEKYIAEAKNAVKGSKSKERLLEAVENLSNALTEVQKEGDFDAVKLDLNAYRLYCDRACELLETTEDKAPGASRLIRKGLPIIDERIKGILSEIQERAKALCKQVKDTEYKEVGQQVNNVGQELTKIRDPIGLEKGVNNMLIPLSAMCEKMPKKERGEACELLKKIKQEQYVEDKLPLINMLLSKFSSQMDPKIVYVNIEKSNYAQVSIGNDNYQVQNSNSPHEKD